MPVYYKENNFSIFSVVEQTTIQVIVMIALILIH